MPLVSISKEAAVILTKVKGLFELETGRVHYRGQVVEIALRELYAHKSKKP
jgi:hypothetical protein